MTAFDSAAKAGGLPDVRKCSTRPSLVLPTQYVSARQCLNPYSFDDMQSLLLGELEAAFVQLAEECACLGRGGAL